MLTKPAVSLDLRYISIPFAFFFIIFFLPSFFRTSYIFIVITCYFVTHYANHLCDNCGIKRGDIQCDDMLERRIKIQAYINF